MNIRLVIYGLPDSLSRITPLKKASHPQYGSDSFACLCQLQPGILQEEKGRQDVAGEAAVLAQQTAFALGERSNMGLCLLSLVTSRGLP